MTPRVSVIIPCYNRARTIERALRSVVQQTMSNHEVIVCDDASDDGTLDLVRGFAAKDARIQVISLPRNVGPAAARNSGMRIARGEYIAFLDSDDEWLPEKLARQVERMDAESHEVGVCLTGATIIKNYNESGAVVTYMPRQEWEADTFRRFVTGQIQFLTPTILCRKHCIEAVGLMMEGMRRNEDAEFLLRMLSQYRLAVIREVHAVCHLDIGVRSNGYSEMNAAVPYHMSHESMIRQRLGPWPAAVFRSIVQTNVACAAIRERRWRAAGAVLLRRVVALPFVLPRDIRCLARAFAACVRS
jgi:glycosyltransferase involved in cell wall biosynthesis